MDFLDPKKKRSHTIRLYIGYVLVGIALTLATMISVFAAYGYDIDRNTGGIIQNGLVIVSAHPESATVLLDGKNKGTTDSRLVLPANKYSIELQRSGYKSWKHDIYLEGSSIEQLVYPFLFPEKLVTKTLQTYDAAPQTALASPDRRWVVVSSPGAVGSFQLIDLNDTGHPVTTISLPPDTLTTNGSVRFTAIEWSSDNNHVLIKHTLATGQEFILLNREKPEESVNINKLFVGQTFSTVSLRDKKPDQFYLHDTVSGTIFLGDGKTRGISALVTGAVTYRTYQNDTLMYVTHPAGSQLAEVHLRQKDDDFVLRSLPKSTIYLLDMASFSGHFYLAVGSHADNRVYVYKDPLHDLGRNSAVTPLPFRVLITPNAQYVSFSTIARFIAVQGGSGFAVYDAETDRQYRYDTKLPLEPFQQATWMDGHRLMLISQKATQIFDFDGTNMHQLSPALPAYVPFFDRDYSAMFTLAPGANSTQVTLIRTELKAVPDGTAAN